MINNLRSSELYDAIEKANERREYKHWHASSIAECPRTQYMKRLGRPSLNNPTGAKILRWNAGHAIEFAIRDHIEKVYGSIDSNKRFTSDKLDLTGEFDNLVLSDSRLIEIKSVHDFAFHEEGGVTALKEDTGQKGPRGGKVFGLKQDPYMHHELQNHAYVLLLKEQGIEVKSIDYVYISLGGRIAVYSTRVSGSKLEAVERRLKELREAWERQEPPKCLCKDYDSPLYAGVYRYCDYRRETTGECCEL